MKRIWIFLTAIILSLAFAIPVFAESQDMWAYVYRDTGKIGADGKAILTRIESGITFQVLAVNTTTEETITYYGGSTSLTNPVTTTNYAAAAVCNKMVSFRIDPTDATYDRYVDLIVVDTAGGYTRVVEDFDKYTHAIVIDERPNVQHHGVIWFKTADAITGGSATETNTGVGFLANTFIQDVRIEVVTLLSGASISVGILSSETGGDADGFLALVALTNAGHVRDTGVVTRGSSTDYIAATTYGALLYTAYTGVDSTMIGAAAHLGGRSFLGKITSNGVPSHLSYTATTSTGGGYIHYFFTKIR